MKDKERQNHQENHERNESAGIPDSRVSAVNPPYQPAMGGPYPQAPGWLAPQRDPLNAEFYTTEHFMENRPG